MILWWRLHRESGGRATALQKRLLLAAPPLLLPRHRIINKPEPRRILILPNHHLHLFPQLQPVRRNLVSPGQRPLLRQRRRTHQFVAVPFGFHHVHSHSRRCVRFVPISIKNRLPPLVAEHFHDRILLGLPRQLQPDRRIDQFCVPLAVFRSVLLRSAVPSLSTANARAAHATARKADVGPAISSVALVRIVHLALVGSGLRIIAFVAIQFPCPQNIGPGNNLHRRGRRRLVRRPL